jgi:nucleoid-associated protein YgaU
MAVKHAPKRAPVKHAAKPKPKPLTPEQQAVRELYPRERSPYKPIPPDQRGPGKLAPGHQVILQAWGVSLQVTAQLGVNGAHVTGGYGNWAQVLVPRADPLTQWSGRNLITMDLDLVIDGYAQGRSVEPQIKALEALATRDPAMLTPPAVRIYGAVPHPALKWVIAGIDYTNSPATLRKYPSGERLRESVTVHLMEYRDETTLVALPRAAATPAPPSKYKVKRGDTLKTIAARRLGKSSRWPDIAKLNKGLRGPKLAASWIGKTIKLPAK